MSATVLRLPDGHRGRQLLAELHRRLQLDASSTLRIGSYGGQALLFVPDSIWRETWIEEVVSSFGATIVAFDVSSTLVDREAPRIVLETADPSDHDLREHVAVVLLRHRLMPLPDAGNAEAVAAQLLTDVTAELRRELPNVSIEVVRASGPSDGTGRAPGPSDGAGRAVVWRLSREAEVRRPE